MKASRRTAERPGCGDGSATDELMPVVYHELRSLAARFLSGEAPGHTLQPTALVHEAYMRLSRGQPHSWQDRARFFGAAATALRRILVEHARSRHGRRRAALRHRHEPPDPAEVAAETPPESVLAVDAALERLAAVNPQQARMVEMRFFGGMSTPEIAAALRISPRTIARDWVLAKAWLARELRGQGLGH